MLNLGLWKKLPYIVDLKSALTITSMFADFTNFRQIYLGFYSQAKPVKQVQKALNSNNFYFLGTLKVPEDDLQVLALKTALDSIVWTLNNEITLPMNENLPLQFKLSETVLLIQKKQCPQSSVEEVLIEID